MTEPTFSLDPNTVQRGGPRKTRVSAAWPFGPTEEHTDALLELAATTHGPLTPAQARAALRRAHPSTPEALADLAAGARTLAEQARALEVAAGSAARTAGMDTPSLAEHLGLGHRTVQERYRHHRLRVEAPSNSSLALLRRSPDGQPLPVVLELAPTSGRLSLTYGEPDTAPTEATWTGTVWRWPVPLLTGPGGSALLQALQPLVLRVLVGIDRGDQRRVPDADARAAADEIARVCAQAGKVYPALRQRTADEHFADQVPQDVATTLGLPAGAGPVQVAAAAEVARENALRRLVLLTGTEAYLAEAVTQPRHR